MKHLLKLSLILLITSGMIVGISCKNKTKVKSENKQEKTEMQKKVEEFALVDLTTDLSLIGENEKQLIPIFIEISKIMDDLFWKQTFGDKTILDTIQDSWIKDFVNINYGPWERLNDNHAFVNGYGVKPAGCTYYPQDMTKEEFEACQDKNKSSLYTVIRRGEDGKLKTVWYKDEYKQEITKVCELLQKAIDITKDEGLKKYLTLRKKAFETDNYFESDMAWMDMKNSMIDFVVGPIENYDDKLYESKASYEAFVLVKDKKWSSDLAKYTTMLPQMQKDLPCAPEHKKYIPGTSSDLNVYDVIYYAGDCNSGSKTIAINLPNDDRVQAQKGSRRLQLKNAMKAKYDKILAPIGELLIEKEQQKHLKFDAFFANVTFHEVTHGLGVKQTINGKGSVDEAMKDEKTSWEEAKADILGLFMVNYLIDKGGITNITKEDAITTYIAGIFRSVRFGAASSHGKANMMCFNFFEDHGAFMRHEGGVYHIDYAKAQEVINEWAALILKTQATGDYKFAKTYRTQNGNIRTSLQKDLALINNSGIPVDIRYNQGLKVLGL